MISINSKYEYQINEEAFNHDNEKRTISAKGDCL